MPCKQLLFYHSYHANVVNQVRNIHCNTHIAPATSSINTPATFHALQVIHIACVWPIFWTALVLLHHGPRLCATPTYLPASLAINPALLATVFYVVWYVALEVKNHNSLSGLGLLAVRVHSDLNELSRVSLELTDRVLWATVVRLPWPS